MFNIHVKEGNTLKKFNYKTAKLQAILEEFNEPFIDLKKVERLFNVHIKDNNGTLENFGKHTI